MIYAEDYGTRRCAILGLLGLMACAACGNAFTFMDSEATSGPIRRLVLTPQGTPWVITEAACTNRRGFSVYHLLYWDGRRFKGKRLNFDLLAVF